MVISLEHIHLTLCNTLCGILLVVLGAKQSLAQWVNVTPDSTAGCNQVVFTDSLHGYIAAGLTSPNSDSTGAIFSTTDGGKTWIKHIVSPQPLLSVSAIGDSLVWASGYYSTVYRSQDGGNTWKSSIVHYTLITVQFVDSLNGWCIGKDDLPDYPSYSGIFHSSDGGVTWTLQYGDTTDYGPTYQGEGYFLDRHHGWAAEYIWVRRTTNGSMWNNFAGAGFGDYVYSVFFLDTLHGWALGSTNELSKSVDGGADWTSLDHSFQGLILTSDFTSVFFSDTLRGWVCDGDGTIIHTTDGGKSWSIQFSDSTGKHAFNSIFFINKNDGWAVGSGVFHTTNGGGVTAVQEPVSNPSHFRLLQNYPNPFNPTTSISYQLSAVSDVTLKIYDVLGREVAVLVDGKQTAGLHTVTWNASPYASGVYFYRLTVKSFLGSFVKTRAMTLIK